MDISASHKLIYGRFKLSHGLFKCSPLAGSVQSHVSREASAEGASLIKSESGLEYKEISQGIIIETESPAVEPHKICGIRAYRLYLRYIFSTEAAYIVEVCRNIRQPFFKVLKIYMPAAIFLL